MEYPLYDYAVIGGDMRQVYLVEELAHHKNRIIHYDLIAVPDMHRCSDASVVINAVSPQAAIQFARCVICPIPLSKNELHLNQSVSDDELLLTELLPMLQPGQFFFAGCIPADFSKAAEDKGVFVFDLMNVDFLSYYNTVATAEGAICEAIKRSPLNLYQSRCAVLGYGKCGTTITSRLKGLSGYVTVYSNQNQECALASNTADKAENLDDLSRHIKEYDFIFNTIPAPVITKDHLKLMKNSVTIIDIASAPGGVDFAEAKRLGLSAVLCPGLPGKYAPSSSAKSIRKTVESIYSKHPQKKSF